MPKMKSFAHGQFCWVDFSAHNFEAATHFYGQLFGWDCSVQQAAMGPYGMFTLKADQVAGVGAMTQEMIDAGLPAVWNSYISVDDIQAVTDKAAQLGAQIIVPVMEIPEAGKLSFIQPPDCGVIAFWEANVHCGAGYFGEPNSFGWNELVTRKPDQACKFFAELLGWEYEDNPHSDHRYDVIKLNGQNNGGIMEMIDEDGWGDAPPHWIVYFCVADIEASTAKITELKGKIEHGPFDTPVGKIAFCVDSQGGRFNLIQLSE